MTVLSYCGYDLEIILAAVNSFRVISWALAKDYAGTSATDVAPLQVEGQPKSDSSALQSLWHISRLVEVYASTET